MVTLPKGPEAPQRSPFHHNTWTLSPSPVGLSRAIGAPLHSLRSEYPRAAFSMTTPPPRARLKAWMRSSMASAPDMARLPPASGSPMVLTIASRPHASIRHASHPGPVDGTLPARLHSADVAEPAGAGRRRHSRSRTADRHLGPEHHGAAGDDQLHQLPSCAQPDPLVGARHR